MVGPSRLSATALSVFLISSFSAFANANIQNNNFSDLLSEKEVISNTPAAITSASQELWEKFLVDTQSLESRKAEHANKALVFKDKTMKFSMDKIGKPGKGGYPLYIALHGGGQTWSGMNDSQWEHMKIYYKDSVDNGVYVATRGITDNWNLHFEDESYPLYEKLIENMVLFEGVDPNRVYLLGFSAGGDGVYQVVPRMADRFAAGNMSAGHHNWIHFDNLYNTPFLLQVGEYDSMYDRNKVAAQNYLEMQNLKQQYGGGFVSDLFVHTGYGHNGWPDNNASRPLATVIADPQLWLNTGEVKTKQVNSNAVDWLNQHTRTATPTKVVWDLETKALRVNGAGQELLAKEGSTTKLALPHELFYWLDVSVANSFPNKGKLVVEYAPENNSVNVVEATNVDKFRVLVNESMVTSFDTPVTVTVNQKPVAQVKLTPNLNTMTRTMLERGDRNYIFDAEFTLQRNGSGDWEVVQ